VSHLLLLPLPLLLPLQVSKRARVCLRVFYSHTHAASSSIHSPWILLYIGGELSLLLCYHVVIVIVVVAMMMIVMMRRGDIDGDDDDPFLFGRTSDQAGPPAEFKHIIRRRKRN